MKFLVNVIGILVVIAILFLISWNRKQIQWKSVLKGLIAQFIIAILLVKVPVGKMIVSAISNGITAVINCGADGLSFVFGDLLDASFANVFIVQVLGNIIFVSALVSVLYYIGVLGFVVKWIGKAVGKLMGTTEVESFVAVANMFLGQTDSPILVSKYLKSMTDSEVMVVLVSGMGSMSVSILGGYHALGIPMEHLLIASALVPVGSILVSKMILPQTDTPLNISDVKMDNKGNNSNVIEAIAEGAGIGMQMVLAIAASLVGIIGIVAVINMFLGMAGIRLEQIFSYIFAPIGFLMGLDGNEILMEGTWLGNKLILNEFVAFQDLGSVIQELDFRTSMICSISLCGFANISSLGICVSGIAVLCPEKKSTLSRLVLKAMIGGVFVSILSAMIVGLITLF
ncbi:MAG TPA: NupC/NupG family nucleoside CNT transporter [Candidatus Blautia merdavium]|uniref:NupC/NupG family nucleoside CNT transporter n=1 Tax=Candidatus Blautia merdavium TaxID=2838494 RepID=A0A9D2T9W5_9FIRM|nr:NupC/NupG family nucleoside CNT transporter [Candidatus Blautia merdavium]